jgi:type IX secretion system PorP/SprF family membrane protein
MKNLLLPFLLLLLSIGLKAQDQAIFSHYNINPILINSAVAGFKGEHQALFNARMQWAGFPGAPKTLMAQYHGPLSQSFGVGLGVLTESAADINRMRVQLNYAFRFKIQDSWDVAAGFATELHQIRLNNNVGNSAFIDLGDRIINNNMNGVRFLDASAAIYTTYKKNTFGGFSLNNLVRSRLDDVVSPDENESFLSYYTFFLGHRFDVDGLNFSLEPSVMIQQIRDVPFQMDINLKAGFMDDQLLAGISYRSLGVMGLMLGTQVSPFNLYYSYNVSFQRFQQFNSGAHEITVGLNMRNKNSAFRR